MDEAAYLRKEEQIKNSVGEFNNERKSNRLYKKDTVLCVAMTLAMVSAFL